MENKLGDKGFKGFGKGFGKEIQRYLEEPFGTPSWTWERGGGRRITGSEADFSLRAKRSLEDLSGTGPGRP